MDKCIKGNLKSIDARSSNFDLRYLNIGACTFASAAAATMTSCFLPLDVQLTAVSRGQAINFKSMDISSLDQTKAELRESINSEVIDTWQARWTLLNKGETTSRFFPRMAALKNPILISPSLTLTGHGNFQCHLQRNGKARCQKDREEDNPIHKIFACPSFEAQREILVSQLRVWSCTPNRVGKLKSED
ncbi:hypothetical protein Zmor_010519 [Zophobas morio]|uniref:Uncharacterized protein n=1 Tax=Zophobas morio TaxID=2755281 RepID=A0AA38IJ98_9CUCU|nr:hypothetical protein Zmor_010519 [Zophobas morio]